MSEAENTLKPKRRFRPARIVRHHVMPVISSLIWVTFLLYGLILFGGCTIAMLVIFVMQWRLDAGLIGLVCACFLLLVLREIYHTFHQAYRKRRAAIGFRREHRRIASLKLPR